MEPNHPHYCQPQDINVARGIEIRRQQLAEVKMSREKPSAVATKILDAVIAKHADKGVLTGIEVAAVAHGSKGSLARAVHRVNKILYPPVGTSDEKGSDLLNPNFIFSPIKQGKLVTTFSICFNFRLAEEILEDCDLKDFNLNN